MTVEEFKEAVQKSCMGRPYRDFPQAMKLFIDSHFKLVDINGNYNHQNYLSSISNHLFIFL